MRHLEWCSLTEKIFVLDTKWKLSGSASASMEDLRQMYAYNRFWKAEKAMLLYPGNPKFNEFKPFLDDDSTHLQNSPKRK